MPLIARVSRLFKADLHAVLDGLEEPASLLKQSIREMEDALGERRQHIARLKQRCDSLRQRARDAAAVPADIDPKLDLCFANGNEELAKKLTRRKVQAARLARHLANELEAVTAELDEHTAALGEDAEQLEALRQKAECLTEAPTERGHAPDDAFAVGEDEVEIAFLHEKQARTPS